MMIDYITNVKKGKIDGQSHKPLGNHWIKLIDPFKIR